MSDPRYPIGRFQAPPVITPEVREGWLQVLAQTPAHLRAAVEGLSEAQLDTPYREGGWTVRQVVHHVPDSHLNSYVRFKLALTEEAPAIKPYDEQAWARLADSRDTPVEVSLRLLEALHRRWVVLLRGLKEEDWQRSFVHPESGPTTLARALGLYAWHGSHHVAHITELRKRMGW
ncbi:putative metal-dependent hydrolase YfiT [Calidithermus terrae]|uniref:Putative metal-dependent hydrolase Mterra_03741 n=1 Tax=Calidithermus terrae TaxID=1408545 RepID=A0A399E2S8_9DEIN|nr:bacillithiol transferase BstA [Calidithermus terrae]RIH77669.1 putative metal-dependent hydrolase YfiT [Calidithermus terrae]